MTSFGSQGQNEKRTSPPNPLAFPPHLLHVQQIQPFTTTPLDPSNASAIVFNDLVQQQQAGSIGGGSTGSLSRQTSIGSHTPTQQGGNVMTANNLQEQLVANLASQLMSRRSMMMNYELSGNGSLFPSIGGQNHGLPNGPNPTVIPSFADNKVDQNERPIEGRYQPATLNRVPCQARGMSTDHNALTAYLEIPNDAIHGLHLMCSHPTCRAAGVKFRYCYYCKKPVTKQNFRSRHLHADLAEKANKSAADSRKSPLLLPRMNPAEKPTTPKTMVCAPAITFPPPLSSTQKNLKQKEQGLEESKTQMPSHHVANGIQNQRSTSNIRPLVWSCILDDRPTDLTLLPVWIANVISISDSEKSVMDYPIPKEKVTSRQTTPTQREADWNALLWERPKGNQGDDEMNTWLMKVLERSSPGYSGERASTGLTPPSNYSKSSYDPQLQFESSSSPIHFVPTTLHSYDDNTIPSSKKRKV